MSWQMQLTYELINQTAVVLETGQPMQVRVDGGPSSLGHFLGVIEDFVSLHKVIEDKLPVYSVSKEGHAYTCLIKPRFTF